jgi:hypothetical protein
VESCPRHGYSSGGRCQWHGCLSMSKCRWQVVQVKSNRPRQDCLSNSRLLVKKSRNLRVMWHMPKRYAARVQAGACAGTEEFDEVSRERQRVERRRGRGGGASRAWQNDTMTVSEKPPKSCIFQTCPHLSVPEKSLQKYPPPQCTEFESFHGGKY